MKYLNRAEEAAADIIAAFEKPAALPRPLAQVFMRRRDGAPCRSWSWRNQLIVAIRGHAEARRFRQWEQVGRQVKAGERAFRILSPLAKKVVDEATGEERFVVFGFRGTPVFGLDQTEGDRHSVAHDQIEVWLDSLPLHEVAKESGLSVEVYNGAGANYLGVYRPGSAIALGVKNLSTWCHELVHAADDRNGRLRKRGDKVKQEVVAQLGGAVLLTILGHGHDADLGGRWEYINHYDVSKNEAPTPGAANEWAEDYEWRPGRHGDCVIRPGEDRRLSKSPDCGVIPRDLRRQL
jgi:hypothetical protein